MDPLVKAVKDAYAAKQQAEDVYLQASTDYLPCHPTREDAEMALYDANTTLQRKCEDLAFFVAEI